MTPKTKEELLALAERVEGLDGPDREVDALIWCALRGLRYKSHNQAYASDDTQVEFTAPPKRTRMVSGAYGVPHAKQVTASLDAAMTLVPAGHRVQLSDWDHEVLRANGPWQAIVPSSGASYGFARGMLTNRCEHAATPALALTAAALRAQAELVV